MLLWHDPACPVDGDKGPVESFQFTDHTDDWKVRNRANGSFQFNYGVIAANPRPCLHSRD